MRIKNTSSETAGSQLVITNLVSFTLIVSAVVILGAMCRFLKRCCARLSKRKDPEHDVIAFKEVRRLSVLRKCNSVPGISTQEYSVVHQEDIPVDTEETAVQPNLGALKKSMFVRPRAPTDPGSNPKVTRQLSAPASSTPSGLARGETSPLAQRILKRGSSSHVDIEKTDLEPHLYRKEALMQKFQTSNKNTCGTLDTEVFYDAGSLELKVKVNSIRQLIHQHAHETNTYVSVKKIPDQKSRRTSIHTKAIDPVYNDEFTFPIEPLDNIACHVLMYGLYHVDKFSKSYLRGEACLPLFQIDLDSRRRVQIPFVEIKRSIIPTMYPVYRSGVAGCILVSLKYEPEQSSIVVTPVRVSHVPRKRHVGYGKNVYIKVDLRHKSDRITKMKTRLVEMERMTGSDGNFYQAIFNEPLMLECKSFLPEETEIHISLNHYLFLKSSFIIGQVRISRKETGYESMHFENMIESPGERFSVWYEMRGYTTPAAMEEVETL